MSARQRSRKAIDMHGFVAFFLTHKRRRSDGRAKSSSSKERGVWNIGQSAFTQHTHLAQKICKRGQLRIRMHCAGHCPLELDSIN